MNDVVDNCDNDDYNDDDDDWEHKFLNKLFRINFGSLDECFLITGSGETVGVSPDKKHDTLFCWSFHPMKNFPPLFLSLSLCLSLSLTLSHSHSLSF